MRRDGLKTVLLEYEGASFWSRRKIVERGHDDPPVAHENSALSNCDYRRLSYASRADMVRKVHWTYTSAVFVSGPWLPSR